MRKLLALMILLKLLSLGCYYSAMQPTVTPFPASALVPAATAAAENPENSIYKVNADALEVRAGPGEKSLNVGYLELGDCVRVYEFKDRTDVLEKCQVWARIGKDRWVCADRLEIDE